MTKGVFYILMSLEIDSTGDLKVRHEVLAVFLVFGVFGCLAIY